IGYWLYSGLDNNIKGVDIDRAIGDDRPEKLPTRGAPVPGSRSGRALPLAPRPRPCHRSCAPSPPARVLCRPTSADVLDSTGGV
ncbi:hypothetical protein ACWES4_28360, partial [Streptomyces sp. NPDC004011]